METELRRTAELEQYFTRFPDLPREAILKEDVLRWGMTFSDAALDACKGAAIKSYRLFSHDKVAHSKLQRKEQTRVPEELRFKGGIYGLRPTLARVAISLDSPYHVDVVDGRLSLTAEGITLAEAGFYRQPPYYSKAFPDGVLYWEVVPLLGFGSLPFVTVNKICQLWGSKQECKFCDINENVRQKKDYGTPFTINKAHKDVQQIAQVMEEIFREKEETPEDRVAGYCVSGGTILNEAGGRGEIDFYLQYVRAIKERIGNRVPARLQIGARSKEDMKVLKAGGVDCIDSNLEVWDETLFRWICPGKEKLVGREAWIRALLEAVEVFGEGNVTPNFVAGVEMARPHGFVDVSEAVKSTLEGFDFLMRHGVTPRMNQWSRGELSDLCRDTEQPVPPLEYFVRMAAGWYELWSKYRLPPLRGFGPMGVGRSLFQQSSIFDLVGT